MAEQNKPPRARANARLLGLIRSSESADNESDSFNPWAMAFHDSRYELTQGLNPKEVASIYECWLRQNNIFQEAERVWTGPFMHRPFAQRQAASFCLSVKTDIESGDGFAVMEALALCVAHGLALPNWLSVAFIERYQRVVSGECKGWGEKEAFGSVVPKGKNLAGVVAVSKFGPWAYEVAVELLSIDPNRPIDVGLYEEVGEKISRKATQVQSLIKQYCNNGLYPPLKYLRDGLLAGKPAGEVFCAWGEAKHQERLRAMGLESYQH